MNKGVLIAKRYEIKKLIGQGGMADVYLAFDKLLDRDVAIKILRTELSNDAVSLLRFKHEAVAVSKLSHPNIIEIYDIGEHDSRQYIVMEYVAGKTLKELIIERGGLYKEEAVYIMKQLVGAVAEAHRNQIIHRDIKPQNILVKSDGSVIITDFGIALAQNALHLTQKDMVMGSVHYLAPELARGETATYQSDIYALGIVFYELLSGNVPFKGDSAIQIAMKQINEEIPSIREFNPSIPQSVENSILKSTAKNRELRFKSADEMMDDLETILEEDRLGETKLQQELPQEHHDTTKVISTLDTVEVQKEKSKKKKQIIIISTAIVVLLSFTMFFILKNKNKVEEVEVPDVVGLTIDEAQKILLEEGFELAEPTREADEELDINHVISSDPKAKEKVEKGSKIKLTISEGKYFIFEDYTNKNYELIRIELENKLNTTVRAEYIYDHNFRAGTIISQNIEVGEKLNPRSRVDIKFVVSKPLEVIIPAGIYGMDIHAAKAQLEEMGVSVSLEIITDSSGKPKPGQKVDVVEYTTPSRNSSYIQSDGNKVVLHYYSVLYEEHVEKPKPEEKPEEPDKTEKPVEDQKPNKDTSNDTNKEVGNS